jgi:Ca-activated chloride channel family protein
MNIQNPVVLWLILLIIPVIYFQIANYQKKRTGFKRLAGDWRFQELSHVFLVKVFFSTLFFALFIICTLLALADIRWGDKLVEENRDGMEIIFAVDVSRSMLASDIYPSRLQTAKTAIKKVVAAITGDQANEARFGLVIFKGEANCVLPLTEDLNAIYMLVDNLNPDLITSTGSNIERAINTALNSFKGEGKFKAIFLYTDGEALSGHALQSAARAGKLDIPIIPICVGTVAGSEIIQNGKKILDQNEKPVLTRLNRSLLEELARVSGGKSYFINDSLQAVNELDHIWRKLEPGEWEKNLRLVKAEMYQPLLALGLFFLILSLLVKGIKWKNLI